MGEQRAKSSRAIIIAIVAGSVLIAIGLAVGLAVGLRDDNNNVSSNGGSCSTTSEQYKSSHGTYSHATVVADSKVASDIGTDMMARKRGNAVDAAVAAMFATCLSNAHSCGIGGGSFIILYDRETNTWHALDARETAPGNASENMYAADIQLSLKGGMASGVPGEVMGLWELHRRAGKLPWGEVVRPSVRLCRDGVPVTQALHKAVSSKLTTPELKQAFSPYFDENGNVRPVGSLVKLPKLADTLQKIADDPMSFYNGSLAKDIVADIQEAGGIITEQDMREYKVKSTPPSLLSLPGGYKVYSINAPGSGPVLNYILSILAGYKMDPTHVADKDKEALTYHRIIEAFKFAYGKRTELGDEDFVDISQHVMNMSSLAFGEATRQLIDDTKTHDTAYYHPSAAITEDQGTSHLAVIDGMGSAVSITSTVNTYFGSTVKGSRTGIVFNNEMNDFSVPDTINYFGLPASPANFIRPGKRPMSSMSPAIVWDENNSRVRMVTGASGGSKITSSTAMNIAEILWLRRSLPAAVDRLRFHHQLIPTYLQLEKGFPQDMADRLKAKGHEIGEMRGWTVVQAIDVLQNSVVGVADYRKGGEPSGF